ncbi:MAG: hypothetical protein A3B92_02495 [Candidatus Harrisonbacteria bacterium RIFCSPHIGHO2_02_FULL_42_16]|uniref:Uncharacterized protein n=1 Tax=Candidatus Harrisonbacteria bacterium RIFCSPHIGHO2_02_FULL_42_16 TaxID=1798404 RepID=A0A1G1ZIX5_9BACT|nr:MAG: hypothetical protein A3B92_02495 [Candidatus Harrisonbacteria bacterium RIFCSPHIGHO2_02_FULL_42_16]
MSHDAGIKKGPIAVAIGEELCGVTGLVPAPLGLSGFFLGVVAPPSALHPSRTPHIVNSIANPQNLSIAKKWLKIRIN